MADSENALPSSKKRAAGRELSRDNPGLDDEEDDSDLEAGTFKRASEEVLATRKILKVRRTPATSAPTSNPFAEGATLNSFQQLSSSQNAFTNLSGTGFSTSTFSFGLISKDGSALSTGSGSLFGSKSDFSSGLGLSNNGSSSLFATTGPSIVPRGDIPSMQEVAVETGEENEKAVFTADAVLFEFIDGGWKERGKGDLKVNVSDFGADKARLVMRAKGIRKVILNASLYPDMKLANMEKKGVTFACMNSIDEKKDGLSTFALKFKDGSIVEEFRSSVTEHKGKTATVMKTPENSPK